MAQRDPVFGSYKKPGQSVRGALNRSLPLFLPLVLACLPLITGSAGLAYAQEPLHVFVDDDWAGSAPGEGVGGGYVFGNDAFDSIQDGIHAVSPSGGTVHVFGGAYYEYGIGMAEEADIRVLAVDGPAETTIDGGGNGSLIIASKVGDGTVFEGFTITNGSADTGGGIDIRDSSPAVINCRLYGNSAFYGGGIFSYGVSSPLVTNCTFSENSANCGGGIRAHGCRSITVNNCIFSGNTAAYGGAVYIDRSSPTITNCTFHGNEAAIQGGGIYSIHSSPAINNCILWGNTDYYGNEIFTSRSTPAISHSNIRGSGGSVAWAPGLGTDGGGNMDANPEFAGAADLHLKTGSPCIDAGRNDAVPSGIDTDIDGESRIFGAEVDMGADEVVDTDGDGMPDRWEILYSLDPLADDADLDPDGDGLKNLEEYHGGTDPHFNNGRKAMPWLPLLLLGQL